MIAPPKSPATMPESKIVDAWAMIAWLLDQAAAPAVELFFQEADAGNLHLVMSWMNVGEVYYIISKRYGPERTADFLKRLPSLPIRLVLPDEDGILAADIKAGHPVSFCDAFAIALAQAEKASSPCGLDRPHLISLLSVSICVHLWLKAFDFPYSTLNATTASPILLFIFPCPPAQITTNCFPPAT
jgi:predicted nucleic acid-binding protein